MSLQTVKSHSSPGQLEQGFPVSEMGTRIKWESVIECQYENPEGPCARVTHSTLQHIEAFLYPSATYSQGRVVHKRDPGLSIIRSQQKVLWHVLTKLHVYKRLSHPSNLLKGLLM